MPLRASKEHPGKGVAFATGTHFVVPNDGFWRTCSALTYAESTTSAGAPSCECPVRRGRQIESNDWDGRNPAAREPVPVRPLPILNRHSLPTW